MLLIRFNNPARQACVVVLAACLAGIQATAALPLSPQSAHTAQVKAVLEKLGVNKSIAIVLSDGEKLHGRISGLGEESFTLAIGRKGVVRDIPYEQVTKIHPGPSKLIWISLGAIAVAVVIVIVALARTPSVH
ncbi:MAG: hypothetical protein KGM47_18805 [Acidobacteriota bacterium]|nr:hypothetical protein [Acidobacteriota bacterium]